MLELFCGIGGCAAALPPRAEVAAAVDINQVALGVYAANFEHTQLAASIEWLPSDWFRRQRADLWWLSPPCQPYTVRGKQLDTADPRAAGLLALIDRIAEVCPPHVALENVPGFLESESRTRLLAMFGECGYTVEEQILCPTALGIPNRRRRYYLLASQSPLAPRPSAEFPRQPLRAFLDDPPEEGLEVEPEIATAYEGAADVVDAKDEGAIASCFTSAYGKSHIRSGSYLRAAEGWRRFAPREIARLLGFPEHFKLPPELPRRKLWQLLGNSLSVRAVRHLLAAIPEAAD